MLVAEHPGSEESQHQLPLIGPAGKELRRMLDQLGVALDDIYKTNVFDRQPAANDLSLYTTTSPSDASRSLGPLLPGAWANDDALSQLARLDAEIMAVEPNVIVALGAVAAWALVGRSDIRSVRGAVHPHALSSGRVVKVVPTYHPGIALRQYSLRTIIINDIEKALAESHYPELRYDHAEIWTEPTLDDLAEFGRRHLGGATLCSLDVETRRGQLTCVGIAPSRSCAIVVPFWTGSAPRNYWPDTRSELQARKWLARIVEDPAILKVTQNGLYDIQYLMAEGMKPRGFLHDTMIAHHSLFSELPKSLAFLGATYTNNPTWKGIHKTKAADQLKRDE